MLKEQFECALCGARSGLTLNVLELESGKAYWFCNWEHLHLWWEQLKMKVQAQKQREDKT